MQHYLRISSKSKACKLTIPGVEKAEGILKELNGEQGA